MELGAVYAIEIVTSYQAALQIGVVRPIPTSPGKRFAVVDRAIHFAPREYQLPITGSIGGNVDRFHAFSPLRESRQV